MMMGEWLEKNGFKRGAEIGVQRGHFAHALLAQWRSCERYLAVDPWREQEAYPDPANAPIDLQEEIYREAVRRLAFWEDRVVFLRKLSSAAAALVPDGSLDFVYIDARHDYCSVAEDMELWWPKLAPGGLLSGHDYFTTAQVIRLREATGTDFGLCPELGEDGLPRRDDRAVKGAVDDFAARAGLSVYVTDRAQEAPYPPSWMVFKPRPEGDSRWVLAAALRAADPDANTNSSTAL